MRMSEKAFKVHSGRLTQTRRKPKHDQIEFVCVERPPKNLNETEEKEI